MRKRLKKLLVKMLVQQSTKVLEVKLDKALDIPDLSK